MKIGLMGSLLIVGLAVTSSTTLAAPGGGLDALNPIPNSDLGCLRPNENTTRALRGLGDLLRGCGEIGRDWYDNLPCWDRCMLDCERECELECRSTPGNQAGTPWLEQCRDTCRTRPNHCNMDCDHECSANPPGPGAAGSP